MADDLSQLRESLRKSFLKIKEDILSHESQIKKLSEENKKLLLSIQKLSSELKKKTPIQSKTSSKELTSIKSQIYSIKKNIIENQQSSNTLQQINSINKKIKKIEKKITNIESQPLPLPQQEKFESLIQRLEEKITALGASNTQPHPNTQPQIHSIVGEAVKQAVSSLNLSQQKSHKKETETPFAHKMMKKIERNKKEIIKQRIIEIIRHTPTLLPELKEIVVDEKKYCSKASFYRYIDELIQKNIIAFSKKGDNNLVTLKDKSSS